MQARAFKKAAAFLQSGPKDVSESFVGLQACVFFHPVIHCNR